MITFLKKLGLGIAPFLGMILFSLWVDPLNLFPSLHTSRFREMVDVLQKGDGLAFEGNINDRALEYSIISSQESEPQVIVLGSSRVMQIGQEVASERLMNHGVSGAMFEDVLVLSELYLVKDIVPKKWIVGIDPWHFNERVDEFRWRHLEDEYFHILKRIGLSESDASSPRGNWKFHRLKILELISPAYFIDSCERMREGTHFTEGSKASAEIKHRKPDGSIVYGTRLLNRSEVQVERRAKEFTRSPIYRLEEFRRLSPSVQKIFAHWLDYLGTRGVEVEIFLAPYHPATYSVLESNEKYRFVEISEQYVREQAASRGIKVVGSFSPEKAGLESIDFYDGMHPRRSGVSKLFQDSQ